MACPRLTEVTQVLLWTLRRKGRSSFLHPTGHPSLHHVNQNSTNQAKHFGRKWVWWHRPVSPDTQKTEAGELHRQLSEALSQGEKVGGGELGCSSVVKCLRSMRIVPGSIPSIIKKIKTNVDSLKMTAIPPHEFPGGLSVCSSGRAHLPHVHTRCPGLNPQYTYFLSFGATWVPLK